MRGRLRARVGWTVIGVTAIAAGLLAQTPSAPQTPAGEIPTFRAGTRLIPLDVRVVDKQGRPVTDLTQADFTITENDVRQDIKHFFIQSLVPADPATLPPVAEPLRRVAGPMAALAPQDYRVYLIYLSRGDLTGPAKGIDGIIHLVRDRLLPQDRVAIVAWNRATEFTLDRTATIDALTRFKTDARGVERKIDDFFKSPICAMGGQCEIPRWLQGEINAVFEGSERTPMRTVPQQLPNAGAFEERTRETFERLNAPASDVFSRQFVELLGLSLDEFMREAAVLYQDLGNLYAGIEYLRHFEGEKHLIMLAEYGFGGKDDYDLARDLGRAAADARVVVSVIRAGGVVPAYPNIASASGRGALTGGPYYFVGGVQQTAYNSNAMAELTGGRSDVNRYSGAVSADMIEQSSRFQYLLGYYPANGKMDGKFRKIRVTVSRPGVTVLVRGGYIAREEEGPLDLRGAVTFGRIASAATMVREMPDMPLKAVATSRPGEVAVSTTVDISRVYFEKQNDGRSAQIEVWAFALDKKQKGVGELRQTVMLRYTETEFAAAKRDGARVTLTVPVTGAAESLKLVAYNFDADLTGSLNVAVGK